jgi:hypothetical protein
MNSRKPLRTLSTINWCGVLRVSYNYFAKIPFPPNITPHDTLEHANAILPNNDSVLFFVGEITMANLNKAWKSIKKKAFS